MDPAQEDTWWADTQKNQNTMHGRCQVANGHQLPEYKNGLPRTVGWSGFREMVNRICKQKTNFLGLPTRNT